MYSLSHTPRSDWWKSSWLVYLNIVLSLNRTTYIFLIDPFTAAVITILASHKIEDHRI